MENMNDLGETMDLASAGAESFSRPFSLRSAVPMSRSVRCKVDKREVYWEVATYQQTPFHINGYMKGI